MRVLVVTAWFPSSRNPALGSFVEKDAAALSARHDVEIVHLVAPALAEHTAPARPGPLVHSVPMSPSRPDDWVRAARRVGTIAQGFDLVHSMAFPSLLPLLVSRPRVPWVHTEHWSGVIRPETLPASWRVGMPVLRQALRRPDAVTAVTDQLADAIRRTRRRGATATVPTVVDPPASVAPLPDGDALRLVAVGGLVDGKDPLLAVETLAELRRRGTDASLTWVGGGPLREVVELRARELGVAEHLRLTGAVPPAVVFDEIDRHHVFLLPTRHENFCTSAAEALVRGRPAVVGSNGGHASYFTPEIGVLVDERTSLSFADGVESARSLLTRRGPEEIAGEVAGRFSSAAVLEGFERSYAAAIARHR